MDEMLKRLHLANARRVWRDLVKVAEKERWTYDAFFARLISEEIAHRKGTRLKRLSSRAHFPFLKTIDEFDFTFQSTVRLELLGSCLSPDFVTEGNSLILFGKTGAARRISRSRSRTAPFRTDSTRSSPPRPSSSTTSQARAAKGECAMQ